MFMATRRRGVGCRDRRSGPGRSWASGAERSRARTSDDRARGHDPYARRWFRHTAAPLKCTIDRCGTTPAQRWPQTSKERERVASVVAEDDVQAEEAASKGRAESVTRMNSCRPESVNASAAGPSGPPVSAIHGARLRGSWSRVIERSRFPADVADLDVVLVRVGGGVPARNARRGDLPRCRPTVDGPRRFLGMASLPRRSNRLRWRREIPEWYGAGWQGEASFSSMPQGAEGETKSQRMGNGNAGFPDSSAARFAPMGSSHRSDGRSPTVS